jgi:hypothetical protein
MAIAGQPAPDLQHADLLRLHANPGSRIVSVAYVLPEPSSVTLSVFDRCGRPVRNLLCEFKPAGIHSVSHLLLPPSGRPVPGDKENAAGKVSALQCSALDRAVLDFVVYGHRLLSL